MKAAICWRYTYLLAFLAVATLAATSRAQPQQEIVFDNARLQEMLNPTLQSLQITAASNGGNLSVRLPDGQTLSRAIDIGDVTVPAPAPLPAVICTVKPIRNDGAPVVNFVNGRVQLSMILRPVAPGIVIITRWARKSIFLLPPPGISVTRINVTGSFKFAQNPKNARLVVADDLQVKVRGDWRIVGLLTGASASIRNQIDTAVAANVQDLLKKDLNLMVGVSLLKYLNTRAELKPVQLQAIRNEAARAVFVVRAPEPALPDAAPEAPVTGSEE